MATCPECDAEIEIDEDDLKELQPGDSWDCDACASRLRVVTLDPLELEVDDDEDEDDDEKTTEDAAEGDDFDDGDEDEDDDEDDEWEQ